MRNVMGGICDPNTVWMLLQPRTLELRMDRAGESAETICEFLRDHPRLKRSAIPASSSPVPIRRMITSAIVLLVDLLAYLKGGEREAFAFLDGLKITTSRSASVARDSGVRTGGDDPLVGAGRTQSRAWISDNLVRISSA
jgi:methionine-gamma-lyase